MASTAHKLNGHSRHFRLILAKKGSPLKRRIAFKYFDNAVRNASYNLLRGSSEYEVLEVVENNGTIKDGPLLATGSREGNTTSSTVNTQGKQQLQKDLHRKPFYWPNVLHRKSA